MSTAAQIRNPRERLLDAALDLIYARSYEGVGVQEICGQAGLKKGSFYHFFPSKRDLTLAALDRRWELAKQAVWEPAFSKKLPPLGRLERCMELFYEYQCGVKTRTGRVLGCPFGNMALELSTQEEQVRKKVDRIFKEAGAYLEEALRDAILAGQAPKQDVRVTAQAILAYMEGVLLLAKTKNDPEVIRQLAGNPVRNLVGGRGRDAKRSRGATKQQ